VENDHPPSGPCLPLTVLLQTAFNVLIIINLAFLTTACHKSTLPESVPPPRTNEIAATNLSQYPAIAFSGTPAVMVLHIYRELMDAQIDMQMPPEALNALITLQTEPNIAESEAARLIEDALREQAGIVVTRVDDKNLKVTFDNAVKRK
jgi:hypothetical protein